MDFRKLWRILTVFGGLCELMRGVKDAFYGGNLVTRLRFEHPCYLFPHFQFVDHFLRPQPFQGLVTRLQDLVMQLLCVFLFRLLVAKEVQVNSTF